MKYRSLALFSALVPGAGLTACSSSGDPASDGAGGSSSSPCNNM
ncbi:hypothetical protein [Streptomyces coelicoflavus]|nr:hypothetical protein [Streptomyces coelicoflavus]